MCDTNFNVQKKKEIKTDNIEIFQSVILWKIINVKCIYVTLVPYMYSV